jgi:DNA-binding transcriptional ArsR family regulator
MLARDNGCVQPPAPDENVALLALSRALVCSDARVRILRTAFREGYCTAAGLMGELGLSRSALTSQIRPLVAAGLLVVETDPHNTNLVGGSNRRRWRIDADAFDEAVNDFRRTITGHE